VLSDTQTEATNNSTYFAQHTWTGLLILQYWYCYQ